MVEKNIKDKKVYASGKRKAAVAKAVVTSGTGKVTFNKKNCDLSKAFGQIL